MQPVHRKSRVMRHLVIEIKPAEPASALGRPMAARSRCNRVHSSVGVTTNRRAELADEETSMTAANDQALRQALEAAGVEFIDENGGGPGVRLRRRQQKKGSHA